MRCSVQKIFSTAPCVLLLFLPSIRKVKTKATRYDVLFKKSASKMTCVALLSLPSAQKIKEIVYNKHVLLEISAKHHIYLSVALLSLFNTKALQLQALFCSETEFDIRCARLSPSATQMTSGQPNVSFFCSQLRIRYLYSFAALLFLLSQKSDTLLHVLFKKTTGTRDVCRASAFLYVRYLSKDSGVGGCPVLLLSATNHIFISLPRFCLFPTS